MNSQTSDLKTTIGFDPETRAAVIPSSETIQFINLQLASMGEPIFGDPDAYPLLRIGRSLVAHYEAKDRLREALQSPVDQRIEHWLNDFFKAERGDHTMRLPGNTFTLSQHGLARTLSLPADGDSFSSDIIDSYRIKQGVLHNPKNDRRTTKGVFHVCEGGLPIPADKKSVPKGVFLKLFEAAMRPPESLMELPYTANQEAKARCWVSLLLRPVICPKVPGFIEEKSLEVHFFAPGNLVSNLDFVESIFGNAGDPFLRENDSGLDIEHWSGHSGCVILAPHLIRLKKKALGLPHIKDATEGQKADGMCWENEDELYNDGGAFKITTRNEDGVVVTIIADNYFGYCKKEVKTQIGFAANLYGIVEEEHAGGAMAFPSYDLGEDFRLSEYIPEVNHTFESMYSIFADNIDLQPEGYGVDKKHSDIIYVPEDARFTLHGQRIAWLKNGEEQSIKLLAGMVYVLPSGYKVELRKPGEGRRWRLIGTSAQATVCHKPCTVSGGGKSEISKSIADAIIHLPLYVQDLEATLDFVDKILNREYGMRFKDDTRNRQDGRSILCSNRSLGSVIKLLTVRDEYTDEHNTFVRTIPNEIKEFVLLIKRFYKSDWGDVWRERFSVDVINGVPGHELKYRNNKVIASYLRLGFEGNGSWRVFGLRKDFSPASKIQLEDDITASVVVPSEHVDGLHPEVKNPSVKFIHNCEYRLFQRPDEAVVRGYDKKAEIDLSSAGSFLSNYQPITREEATEMVEDSVRFEYFTDPMKQLIEGFVKGEAGDPKYVCCSANPRLVDGVPTKNPRYLQTRLNLEQPRDDYVADVGARLYRSLQVDEALPFPVNAVLTGRRNNPPEGIVRSLAVFNPIHYMPLPEAFMEFISSMTGKSPSTTGAGSEGALTKAPFNALLPVSDLNSALLSYLMTGYEPFVTAAGYVGPKFRVDHDISLLVPEIWCRMKTFERDPQWMIANGFLEKVPNVQVGKRKALSSVLGYRITQSFVTHFMGRIFSNPSVLFTSEMIRPELQDGEVFADGMENILATHKRVAENYFQDGSIELAIPPLRALLEFMRKGDWESGTLQDPQFRKLFDRNTVIKSDWYQARLDAMQEKSVKRWKQYGEYLNSFDAGMFEGLDQKKAVAVSEVARVESPEFRQRLIGTIGVDPSFYPVKG